MKWLRYFIGSLSFLLMYIGIAGLTAYVWVVYNFGAIEWEQVMLNLAQPMNGVAIGLVVTGVLLNGVVSFILTIVFAKIIRKKFSVYAPLGYILVSGLCLLYPIYKWHLVDFVLSRLTTGTLYETEHHIPEIKVNGRNLIVIVLESYEKSYQNALILEQNLSPQLTQIQNENISFSGFKQIRQSSWTITSLLSSFCGVPLKLNKLFVDLDTYRTFIPGMTCWPEQFAEQGYETVLMKAAAIQFTATDRFAAQHGFKKAVGYRELREKYEQDQISRWGLDDRSFYQAVKDELIRLSQLNKPFVLTTVQADTHQPVGHLNKTCSPLFDDYRDAIRCSDKEAAELIRWIQQQSFYPQTTIVVIGDHLVSATNIDSLLEKIPDREIYFTLINPAKKQTPYPHTFTNLDVAPTILDALGVDFDGHYGLGHSLFRSDKTLIEKKGKQLEYELDCYSEKYHSWGNDLPPSVYEAPETLEVMPFNETVAFEHGINKYFAVKDIVEMVTNQYWTRDNVGFLKIKTEASSHQAVDLTLNFVIPAAGGNKQVRILSGDMELARLTYSKHTVATEKIRIPASVMKQGIIDLSFEITVVSQTKPKYYGIQFLSVQIDEVN